MQMKYCNRCKDEKSLDSFSKGKSKFGKHSWCRACVAEKKRLDRRDPKTRERVLAGDRRWNNSESVKKWRLQDTLSGRSAERAQRGAKAHYNRNREKILARQKKQRKNPIRKHKVKCNQLVTLMVYFGMIEKGPCVICGEATKVEAAHRGYEDPLDIFWACPRHHRHYDKGIIDEHGKVLRVIEG